MTSHDHSRASEKLADLNDAMRKLLDSVDSNANDTDSLATCWEECQSALEQFQAKAEAVIETTDAERTAIEDHLQQAVRLNAIATHLVQRETERISEELNVLSEARRKLQAQKSRSNEAGGSVDLAG